VQDELLIANSQLPLTFYYIWYSPFNLSSMYITIFYIVSAIWILSEIFLNRFLRSGKSDKKGADKNSELFIWLVIGVSAYAGVYLSHVYDVPIYSNGMFAFVGIALILIGIGFRFWAIKQLGRFFTVDVTIRQDHQLMQSGFYQYLRHPSYAASLLSFFGFGFSLNSWLSLAIVFIPVLFSFIHRMNVEEKVLKDQFGEKYIDYMSKTKRIVPFIY
jgi:protein-S-isoprenylcysteine O-methyltransferase Ste14